MSLDCLLENFISYYEKDDKKKPYWDEWNFYESLQKLDSISNHFIKQITHQDNFSICALSKSGTPFATLLAIKLNKPMYIFSIGEFFRSSGIPVIGAIHNDKSMSVELKKIYSDNIPEKTYLIDSHIHSGQTALLANTISFDDNFENIIATIVIADCREKDISDDPKIKRLGIKPFFNEQTVSTFLEKKKNECCDDFNDKEFWTYHPAYWMDNIESFNSEKITQKIEIKTLDPELAFIIKEKLIIKSNDKKRVIRPDLLFLLKYEDEILLNKLIKKVAYYYKTKAIDTIVAATIAAIPLAIGIGKYLLENGAEIKFIFLSNNSPKTYEKKLKNSSNLIVIDEVVLTGGLFRAVYNSFLEKTAKNVYFFSLFDNDLFPFRDHLNALSKYRNIEYLTACRLSTE